MQSGILLDSAPGRQDFEEDLVVGPPPIRAGTGVLWPQFVSMFLGLCDFAKMHHQQRMAALGTDKELSDLLDFSAVSNCYNIAMTETKAPTYRRLFIFFDLYGNR